VTQSLAAVAFVVPDYDSAIAWFRGALGFELVEDSTVSPGKRWVVVAPPGGAGARLVIRGRQRAPAPGDWRGCGRTGRLLPRNRRLRS